MLQYPIWNLCDSAFHHAHWDQTEESLCPSLGSRPTLVQGPSAHVPLLFGTTFHYLSVQPPRLPPSEDVSKHTFSTWPSPRRHRCAQLPVDVTERLQRLRIWTPIWLLRHWTWLRRGYWRYRNLIDWLIYIVKSALLSFRKWHIILKCALIDNFRNWRWNVSSLYIITEIFIRLSAYLRLVNGLMSTSKCCQARATFPVEIFTGQVNMFLLCFWPSELRIRTFNNYKHFISIPAAIGTLKTLQEYNQENPLIPRGTNGDGLGLSLLRSPGDPLVGPRVSGCKQLSAANVHQFTCSLPEQDHNSFIVQRLFQIHVLQWMGASLWRKVNTEKNKMRNWILNLYPKQ